MPVQAIPDGYRSIQPYLMFEDTRKAIAFYERAFGARTRLCMKTSEGHISHAEIEIGGSVLMMADENPAIEAWAVAHFGGSPVSFQMYTEDCDALYLQALRLGAVSLREPADQPYGDRMAGVQDPFGYRWYLSTHIRDLSREELESLS
jgi:PhnB protein